MQLEIIPYFRIFHFQASSVLHMVFWKCVGVCAEGGGGGGGSGLSENIDKQK